MHYSDLRKGSFKFLGWLLAGLFAVATTVLGENGPPTFTEFESGLQEYPTGYALYVKLDDRHKQVVYAEFLKADEHKRYAAAIKKSIELSVQ